MVHRPRISLCVIAKDEERFVSGCLASAAAAVDEVVLVDTGSTDGTVRIAEAAGARVVRDPWRDDFSRARNAALEASTGDWVLVLDCDECLSPGSAEAVRAFVRRSDVDGGLLRIFHAQRLEATIDEVLEGERHENSGLLLRLFRRTPDLRWYGCVHETTDAWSAARGTRCSVVEGACLVHYGVVATLVSSRQKRERNLRLLEVRAKEEPDNPVPRVYLAGELRLAGREKDADLVIEEAWQVCSARRAAGLPGVALLRVALLRGQRQLVCGDVHGACETLRIAWDSGERHPDLAFVLGNALELRASEEQGSARCRLLKEASEQFVAAMQCEGKTYIEPVDPDTVGWLSTHRAALALLQLGDTVEARALLVRGKGRWPEQREFSVGLVECLLQEGRNAECLQTVEGELGLPHPDPWILAAAACAKLGATGDARLFLQAALNRREQPVMAPHRVKLLGELVEALA
jgi:glycosyltransferase involved in cell wall biosynthesis